MTISSDREKISLVLRGGGARVAFQVGVLKAHADLLPSQWPRLSYVSSIPGLAASDLEFDVGDIRGEW